MQDLVDAMGIRRASLYNAFGSKHALFIEVLKRFEKQRMREIMDRLRDPSQSDADTIRVVLVQAGSAGPEGRSCLMTHTATELRARDTACAEQVETNFARLETAFVAALERGQASGDLAATNTQAAARFLTNALQGFAGDDDSPLRRRRPARCHKCNDAGDYVIFLSFFGTIITE